MLAALRCTPNGVVYGGIYLGLSCPLGGKIQQSSLLAWFY